MGALGAYFCGDFEEMRDVIGHRLRATERSGCLVVIVFANARTELFTKHLRPYLGEWHYRSTDLVEFVFPGYQGLGDPKEHKFKPEIYDNAYQDHTFVSATKEFQARSAWRYNGEPAVIICAASIPSKSIEDNRPADLHLESCVVFDLAEVLKRGGGVPVFFQSIIDFAKENSTYAIARDFSDLVGNRNLLNQVKDGLIKKMASDPAQAAKEIDAAIGHHGQHVRLFISHAHGDSELASRIVDVIQTGLEVPAGALRCTSLPGYQLDLGAMAPDVLRRELGSAVCVLALLTPSSLVNDWVLFELGAAWVNAKVSIPLLAGGLQDKDIPGPFRGAAGGQLTALPTLDRMIDQLEKVLGWRQKNDLPARNKRYELVKYIETSVHHPIEAELRAGFTAKRSRIGSKQNQVIDYITAKLDRQPHISQEELAKRFPEEESSLYYRLEQLRLLGFVERIEIGELSGEPRFGWTLSDRYRKEVGR